MCLFLNHQTLETERTYTMNLCLLVELYVEPLQKKGILSSEQINGMFANVSNIVQLNLSFLAELEGRLARWYDNVACIVAGVVS